MLAHVIGERAGIFHIAAGDAGADDDADLLVFIEGRGSCACSDDGDAAASNAPSKSPEPDRIQEPPCHIV